MHIFGNCEGVRIHRMRWGSSITSEKEDPVETDSRRMCELLVGLGEVDLVGVKELGYP